MNCDSLTDKAVACSQRRFPCSRIAFIFLLIGVYFSVSWIHAGTAAGASVTTISEEETWQYFKGVEDPPIKWSYLHYDASGWRKGQSGFGYGRGAYKTSLNDMKGHYTTIYARQEFLIRDPLNIKGMTLRITCDGPFASYVNGIEVIANNEPVDEDLDISGFSDMFLAGKNVLAVKCTNDDLDSDDYLFVPSFKIYE